MRSPSRALILGAAGRDFHNFNVVYRNDPATEVVAFTAAQIPGIAGRRYPPALAGPRYPDGIPIEPEEALETLVREHAVDLVAQQMVDLCATLDAVPCDMVLLGTPIDLGHVLALRRRVVRVHYEMEEAGRPGFDEILGNL